jgi:hypothetical protein
LAIHHTLDLVILIQIPYKNSGHSPSTFGDSLISTSLVTTRKNALLGTEHPADPNLCDLCASVVHDFGMRDFGMHDSG